jgi:hypothetical protein
VRWVPAPQLLAPPDGTSFTGWNAEVTLQWAELEGIRPDEYYVVRIPYDAAGGVAEFWRKETTFRVPSNFSSSDIGFPDRHYDWTVQVMRCTKSCDLVQDDNVKKQGVAVGEQSRAGRFYWVSDLGSSRPVPTNTRAS